MGQRLGHGLLVAMLGAALGVMACSSPTAPSGGNNGGGGGTGGGGGGTGGGGGGTPTLSATITITSAGVVDQSTVTILQGGRVTFVNNHTRAHDMSSDPHPEHTDCPDQMNQVGFLSAGQSRTSGNFNTIRTCGFHDHNEPGTTGLQGRIIVVQ